MVFQNHDTDEASPSAEFGRQVTIAVDATVLTIAGSDPSGGAGLQVDLKSFQQLGCYGMSVVTLLTVQNTQEVGAIEFMEPSFVRRQLEAVLNDIPPRVIKTGAMGNADIISEVGEILREESRPLVVDPVLVSKHGHRLADDSAVDAYREALMPMANVFTPNRNEAAMLLGRDLNSLQDCAQAAEDLRGLGPSFVLLKAGTEDGMQHHMLASEDGVLGMELPTLQSNNTHGAGCMLSAVIAARLCRRLSGTLSTDVVSEAVHYAITSVHQAIELGPALGHGIGPVESRILHYEDSDS
ncbi:MAG: bifunctional hydroxymethylpyrimidine kinase/phosphomethylpyrimidine kinase [Planctomycetota bacterium]